MCLRKRCLSNRDRYSAQGCPIGVHHVFAAYRVSLWSCSSVVVYWPAQSRFGMREFSRIQCLVGRRCRVQVATSPPIRRSRCQARDSGVSAPHATVLSHKPQICPENACLLRFRYFDMCWHMLELMHVSDDRSSHMGVDMGAGGVTQQSSWPRMGCGMYLQRLMPHVWSRPPLRAMLSSR